MARAIPLHIPPLHIPVEELQFAALQGVTARHDPNGTVGRCPYGRPSSGRSARDNVRAVLWRWGFAGALAKPADETVSREADKRRGAAQPRQGKQTDPRGEPWTKVQLQVLRHCGSVYSAGEIAAMVGRSNQAVRNRLHRMRRELRQEAVA
jgi:hypothetical protein